MKRAFLFLLVVFMLLTALPATAVITADSVDEADAVADPADLPDAFTLVGTKHLPPISNQGSIGTCASSAITYMQFSNAVSRYLHSIDPDIEWDPSSGDLKYLFSPKFTYNYAGSGTEWVYRILMENGALTQTDSYFATDSTGAYQETVKGKVPTQTASWDVGEGMMTKALNFRLTGFEQIWIRRDNDSFGVDGKVQITQTEKGKDLITKIKASLNNGNVVVTGGLSGCWPGGYANGAVVSDTAIAKKGDNVMYCGRKEWTGGHQVCIVGYDDNVTASVPNKNGGKTTLRGAFLMANSWGTGYQNDGYIWIMYDALNEVSEYEELNFDDRLYPMDQFCFVDWKKDITTDLPDLFIEIGVIAGDRSKMSIELLSRPVGASGGTFRDYTPYIFSYAGHNGDYADSRNYTFTGETYKDKGSLGYFTFPLKELSLAGRAGQLSYGVKVTSKDANAVTVLSLKLKNNLGEVLTQIDFPNGIVAGNSNAEFFLPDLKLVGTECLPKVEGATIAAVGASFVPEGEAYSFTVTPEDAGKIAKVTVDGKELTADENGVFTVKMTRASEVSVELADKPVEQPAGSDNKEKGGNTTVIIVVAVVAAVVVIGGVAAVLVIKKKK